MKPIALHKAGVIKYEFRLREERRYSYEQWRVLFGTVTEASASQLRAELKRIVQETAARR
ncbi:MAG: hypothetical protein WD690_12555 [Vicinamibacterales bacterium]